MVVEASELASLELELVEVSLVSVKLVLVSPSSAFVSSEQAGSRRRLALMQVVAKDSRRMRGV